MGYEGNMHYKKAVMKSFIFSLMLASNVVFAHNPDLSNIVISRTDNGHVILQINSALTAFQQEVNYINGEGAYKSPEDFQNLALQHFNASFSIIVNDNVTVQFKNPKVYLGHETKLVAEIIGLPEIVNAIRLKNELFKDIHNNQSVVIFLLAGFPKEKHVLNRDNGHELNIVLKDGSWKKWIAENAGFSLKYTPYLIALLLGGLIVYLIRKRKQRPTH